MAALGWMLVPVVPVVLENFHNGLLVYFDALPRDPYDWDWPMWLMQLGPLVGFGFLAGATLYLPDPEPVRWGPRGWLARRSVWVTSGPWVGGLVCLALGWAYQAIGFPFAPELDSWKARILSVMASVLIAYGWLWPAVAAVRRAKRQGRAWENVKRGLTVSAGFVGSLFGSFWAITEGFRGFFFDPRVAPVLVAAVGLGLLSGCGSPLTYGEIRRRELFHAMLLAWVFGLAVLWRWWSRRKPSA